MCTNVRISAIKKMKEQKEVKDQISDWQENRPIIPRNIIAKNLKKVESDKFMYVKGHPLKLHNGTKVHEIRVESKKGRYQIINVEYSMKGNGRRFNSKFRRYIKDNLFDIEKFLEHSQSICQLRNIDLDYK